MAFSEYGNAAMLRNSGNRVRLVRMARGDDPHSFASLGRPRSASRRLTRRRGCWCANRIKSSSAWGVRACARQPPPWNAAPPSTQAAVAVAGFITGFLVAACPRTSITGIVAPRTTCSASLAAHRCRVIDACGGSMMLNPRRVTKRAMAVKNASTAKPGRPLGLLKLRLRTASRRC